MLTRIDFECFALRGNELLHLHESPPERGRFIAVMLRPVEMPPGPRVPTRPCDGEPVKSLAVLACEMASEGWQWVIISPPSKEYIGDFLMDCKCERDRWYYLRVEDKTPKESP